MLGNFIFDICKCKKTWNMKSFKIEIIQKLRDTINDKKVVCGLSGGVDSTVTAILLDQAIGKNLKCILVDTGLMRKDEVKTIKDLFTKVYDINLKVVNAKMLYFLLHHYAHATVLPFYPRQLLHADDLATAFSPHNHLKSPLHPKSHA
mgnify:CR=1 FL=1